MAIQQKGSVFEREVSVRLSMWVSGGEAKDLFWRTSMSGGRATVSKKKGEMNRQAGDISAIAPEGHPLTNEYYFELKFYKDMEMLNFFTKHKGLLVNFWSKCKQEASYYNRSPVLIAKQNRIPVLLLTIPTRMPPRWLQHTEKYKIHIPSLNCSVYRFDDLLKSSYMRTRRRVDG